MAAVQSMSTSGANATGNVTGSNNLNQLMKSAQEDPNKPSGTPSTRITERLASDQQKTKSDSVGLSPEARAQAAVEQRRTLAADQKAASQASAAVSIPKENSASPAGSSPAQTTATPKAKLSAAAEDTDRANRDTTKYLEQKMRDQYDRAMKQVELTSSGAQPSTGALSLYK